MLLDVIEIFDHAHRILCSVPPIQVAKSGAWKAVTTETVFDFSGRKLLTVLDATHYTIRHLDAVVISTARTSVLVSSKCPTETAVHSAGSNQFRTCLHYSLNHVIGCLIIVLHFSGTARLRSLTFK